MVEGARVTVVCSNYNSDNWIDGYLECINNQTLPKFNIIFVDANSSDNSLRTIKEAKFRPGIGVKVLEYDYTLSIYAAWNSAILAADTEYVINVNTDDRLYPGGLSTYLSYADMYPKVDVFYGSCNVVDKEDHNTPIALYYWPEHSHEALLHHCYCGPFPLLKREAILDAGLFDIDLTISGDYEMWLRLSKAGRLLKKVPDTVGSYYLNPTGMSTDPEKFEEHVKQDTLIRSLHR